MAERSFAREVEDLKLGAGQEFRGEGILAITKALARMRRQLCRRLPGRADLASDGRAVGRAGYPFRPRRAFRIERQRGDRGGDAGRLRDVSDPRRGHVQGPGRHQRRVRRARQPVLGRRHRRRAHHHRRGLRRRLLHHAGAFARLCDEVAALAGRSAAQRGVHRQGRARFLRAVRGVEYARDAGSADPRLPCPWPLRHPRQCPSHLSTCPRARCAVARHQPHRAAAGLVPAREGEDRAPLACGGRIHPRARHERDVRRRYRRYRHHHAGRHV